MESSWACITQLISTRRQAAVIVGDEQREQLRQRYLQVETSNAADVLDDLGCHDQALSPEIRLMTRCAPRLAGRLRSAAR